MIAAVLACALAPLGALSGAQEAKPQEPRRNPILDGIAVQAGDELVTLSEFERELERRLARRPPRNREEEERLRIELLRLLWAIRLAEQRGADLGIDPEQIERISRLDVEAQRDKAGVQAYLARLRDEGTDALADEGDHRRAIQRYMWEETALGRPLPFAGKRETKDQVLRPGEMREYYAENREKLAPVTVQLRVLLVSSERAGSPEAARALCEDARTRVLAGEELALLVEQHGDDLRESGGLTPYIPPQALPDRALALFAEEAELGDLSAVAPLANPRTGEPEPRLGYQLAELVDRKVPPVPEFDSPDVQRTLRKAFLERRAEFVLENERERLRRESYVWLSPLLTGAQPASAPQASTQAGK